MSKLTDTSEMPFGKYKGMAMIDVPANYLLWLYEKGLQNGNVKDYIEDNLEVLKQEIKNKK